MTRAECIVRLDNDEVRVTEWRLPPGAAMDRRLHQTDAITVPLTWGRLRVEQASYESTVNIVPGQIIARKAPCETLILNDGNDPVEFIEIELKCTVRRLISA